MDPTWLLLGLVALGIGSMSLGVRRMRAQRAHRALELRRAEASMAVVPHLERLRVDPEGWREERRAAWPAFAGLETADGERVWLALTVVRRQWTQHRAGVLAITDHRLFFDPIDIRTDWSRTWPSIERSEAGPDHVRVHTTAGDTLVFELDPARVEDHPALVLAVLDHAAALSAARIAALPTA